MKKVEKVLQEVMMFSSAIRTINPGLSVDKIGDFEKRYKVVLPNDYKYLLQLTNGFDLLGTGVYGIFDESVPCSLNGSYMYEHYEVGNPMPLNFVPFSPDGGGNHYCFDSNNIGEESCPIIFWQHDYPYMVDDPPEVVNASFVEWVQEVVIDWALKDYDYNGERKKG